MIYKVWLVYQGEWMYCGTYNAHYLAIALNETLPNDCHWQVEVVRSRITPR